MSPRGARTSRASGARTAAADATASATDGQEAKLWQVADALRNNMDAAGKLLMPQQSSQSHMEPATTTMLRGLGSSRALAATYERISAKRVEAGRCRGHP